MLILYSDIERKSSPTDNIEKKHHFGSFHQVNAQFDGAESIVCLRLIVSLCRSQHGVIILSRNNNSVFVSIFENILKSASLWSHPRLGNFNETRNALSPDFFLKILNSVFESINMSLVHKLFLQLFVIAFCLFCSRIGKI